jgi:Cu/Ag efflux pump CusA
MLNWIIRWSLKNRLIVLVGAAVLLIYGGIVAVRAPVDVFPDLTAPTVTILTESHGMAPEEVESLVSLPIESSMNGTAGVFRVRSNSAAGISIVFVEFNLGTDIYRARQLVTEKLAQVRLPEGIRPPVLGPISSTMGEIMLISMTSQTTSAMDLRSLADWVVRPRLLGVAGVAQVMIIGGDLKQFQVLVDPAKLRDYGLSLKQVTDAVADANVNSSGGFLERPTDEYMIRARGRVSTLEDLANSVITVRNGTPILVRNIANVQLGRALKRGDGSFNMHSDVVATIQKQPNANTIEVTRQIETALAGLKDYPSGRRHNRDQSVPTGELYRTRNRQCAAGASRGRSSCRSSSVPVSVEFPDNRDQPDGDSAFINYRDHRNELLRHRHQHDDVGWTRHSDRRTGGRCNNRRRECFSSPQAERPWRPDTDAGDGDLQGVE